MKNTKKSIKRYRLKAKNLILVAGLTVVAIVSGAYSTWNRLDPELTCARCHEVSPAHAAWLQSAHGGVKCIECHGTALSDGFHSLKEKSGMVFTHLTENKRNDDIHLTEAQVLALSNRCAVCHQAEHAGWLASGHAVNYQEIFMDSAHNAIEKPYWDCFRCHGMFYEGNIYDLMLLEGTHREWHIRDKKQALRPAVPCLACHQIHTNNPVSERYVSTDTARFAAKHPRTALFVRADKRYLRSDQLTKVTMTEGDQTIESSGDPNHLLCLQCHAPDYNHHVGSEDDRTPMGVHKGISCIACHKPHSGNTRTSCFECHAALTQTEVNAVFADPHKYKKQSTIKP